MPKDYWFHCGECGYTAMRYRNVRTCPECKGRLYREEPPKTTVSVQEYVEVVAELERLASWAHTYVFCLDYPPPAGGAFTAERPSLD